MSTASNVAAIKWRPLRWGVRNRVAPILYYESGARPRRPADLRDIRDALQYAVDKLGVDARLLFDEIDIISGCLYPRDIPQHLQQAVFDALLAAMRTSLKAAELVVKYASKAYEWNPAVSKVLMPERFRSIFYGPRLATKPSMSNSARSSTTRLMSFALMSG